jgi:hypothetical protein
MTEWLEGNRSFFMGAQAALIEEDREIASTWASEHVVHNPAYSWVIGRFVESDRANNNRQLFSLKGLQMAQPSIQHAPMNMNHNNRRVVGAFVASELLYPTAGPVETSKEFSPDKRQKLAKEGKAQSDGSFPIENESDLKNAIHAFGRSKNPAATKAHIKKRARALGLSNLIPEQWAAMEEEEKCENCGSDMVMSSEGEMECPVCGAEHEDEEEAKKKKDSECAADLTASLNPYIESLGVVWRHYFPEEHMLIARAHQEGSLFYSMECVPSHVQCTGEGGCEQTFEYAGRVSNTYCEHLNKTTSDKYLINPHFTAGAIIVPPVRPGWANADIHSLVAKQAELAERVYEGVKDEFPHLDAAQWEGLMTELLALQMWK